MIALIDQQFKLSKGESQNCSTELKKSMTLNNHDGKQIPNLASTYKSLKEIIEERIKSKDHERLTELIQSFLSQKELA